MKFFCLLGVVSKQESEIQEAGEAAAEGAGAVGASRVQRRHDEEHLPRSCPGLSALPPPHGYQ